VTPNVRLFLTRDILARTCR